MTLKICTCGKVNTTKNAKKIGKQKDFGGHRIIYFNCIGCNSTFIVLGKIKPIQKNLERAA